MASNVIDRHRGKINVLFMDMTVKAIGLKSLWSLEWHKGWENPVNHRFKWSEWLGKFSD